MVTREMDELGEWKIIAGRGTMEKEQEAEELAHSVGRGP